MASRDVRSWVLWPTKQRHLWTESQHVVVLLGGKAKRGPVGRTGFSLGVWIWKLNHTPSLLPYVLSTMILITPLPRAPASMVLLPRDRGLDPLILWGKINLSSVASVRCTPKAMMKAINAWGAGKGERELWLQLVKMKQSLETVEVFTL